MRLSDEDVDRVARRLAIKLITYGLLIAAALWISQWLVFTIVALLTAGSGNPMVAIAPLTVAILAVPAILLIWIWGRSRRSG